MRKGLYGLAGLVAALLAANGTAGAQEPYPWCAVYSGGRNGLGATICSFVTVEQCRATISGLGGYCQPNPTYPAPKIKAVSHRRKIDDG